MLPATPSSDLFAPAAELLQDLLAVSLKVVNLLRPLYGPDGVVDFAVEYLNPAAQRMTGLAERPDGTMRTRFPDTFSSGVFALYQQVMETGQPGRHSFNYQADGFDNYFHVAARRSGELLVVSFTDTSDQDRTPVELALRESQAAEQAARAEAEAQRQRFYDLLMQLPAQVAVHEGPYQVVTLVNPGYQRLAPGRDLLGQPIRKTWPELASQGILPMLDRVYRTGESFVATELPVQADFTRTGQLEQVYFNAFFLPLRDAQGLITGVLGFSYDVTEQVLARRQLLELNQELEARVQERTATLQASETRFRNLVEQAPVAITLTRGPEVVIENMNAAMLRIIGKTAPEDVLGKRMVEVLPHLESEAILQIARTATATGEPFQGQEVPVPMQTAGALELRYFDVSYTPLRDGQEVRGLIHLALDVTEQVRARQERETQQQQLQRVFAQAQVAICVVRGADYLLDIVNPPMGAMLGRPPEQLLGRPFFEALPELASQGLRPLLDGVRASGTPFVAHEQALRLGHHAAEAIAYFDFVYQPLFDAQAQLTGITCVATEVTTQVRVRQQVQKLNEELQATNAELHTSNTQLRRTNVDLDTFVYTASHDLKAPITNIESIVLALRDTLPAVVQQDEMVAHLLELLNQTVTRFQVTITQLTDISRLQLAHAGPAEPVVLAAVVADVRLDLAPALAAADAQLTVAVAPELVVSFSPANLRSIVYNLLSNAVKYRAFDRPCVVQVRAEPGPGGLVLTVQDNGLGMSEVQQRQLFGLFQRLHIHVEGIGVGLYITKRLIENAGGTITVQSQPGVGTTFTVTFPA